LSESESSPNQSEQISIRHAPKWGVDRRANMTTRRARCRSYGFRPVHERRCKRPSPDTPFDTGHSQFDLRFPDDSFQRSRLPIVRWPSVALITLIKIRVASSPALSIVVILERSRLTRDSFINMGSRLQRAGSVSAVRSPMNRVMHPRAL
jgi:hypothetical protein